MNLPSVFGVVCIFAIQNILLTAGVTAGADASGWDAGSDWVDAGGAATVDADAGTIVPLTGGRTDGRPIDPCVASRKHARPLDTLETQCVNLRAHLPDNFDSALRLSELVLLSEELGRRQSVDMLDDLECLSQRARQAFDDPIETDAKAYAEKLRAYLNQLRGNPSALFDRSLPSKARTPLELRGEWNRTYYETYNQGATTGGEPETRLRYRLGLYCITHDPKWAIYLVDSYQETMRYKEAVDTISWIEQRQQDFDTELTSAVDQKLRMKAELAKRIDSCPPPPVFTKLPAADLASAARTLERTVNEENYYELATTYRRLYCETGLSAQLLNAASVLLQFSKEGEQEGRDAVEMAKFLNKKVPKDHERRVLDEALAIHDNLGHWDQGFWYERHDELAEYSRVAERPGAEKDAHLSYARYFMALLSKGGNGAPRDAERLARALQATTDRYASFPCKGLTAIPLPVSDPLKRLDCKAPPPRPTPPNCGPRQEAHGNICCYENFDMTSRGCYGKCPADMEQDGDWCKCPEGKEPTTFPPRGYCCWPGQQWSTKRGECVGEPVCAQDKGYYQVGSNSWCWDENAVSVERTACLQPPNQAAGSPCTRWAQHHYCKRSDKPLSDDSAERARIDKQRAEEDREILRLYDRGCKRGEVDACWEGARFARMARDLPEGASRKSFLQELFRRHVPGALFPYVEMLENENERAQLLENVCNKEAQYHFEGAATNCGWLADRLMKSDLRRGIALHRFICEHGHWIVKGLRPTCQDNQKNSLDDRDYRLREEASRIGVRHSCEVVALYYAKHNMAEDWKSSVFDALYVLPDDSNWRPLPREAAGHSGTARNAASVGALSRDESRDEHLSNQALRDWLSAQSQGSNEWCGRSVARPNNPQTSLPANWEIFRCWQLPDKKKMTERDKAMAATCLRAEDYSENGHGCPGRRGAQREKLCCPIQGWPTKVPETEQTKPADKQE